MTQTAVVPCKTCGRATVPPDPADESQQGHYCEHCGVAWSDAYAASLAPRVHPSWPMGDLIAFRDLAWDDLTLGNRVALLAEIAQRENARG